MKRLNSIDMARALAIVMMIMCHFTIYMTRPDGAYPGIFFFSDHVLGDSPAAIFLFLVGLCLSISVNQSKQNGLKTIKNVGQDVTGTAATICSRL